MAKFSVTPAPGFNKQLRDGVRRNGGNLFVKRILSQRQTIITKVSNLLVNIFESTDVARALRGNSSTDLPAHFGLTDSQASSLTDAMANVIRKSVSVEQFKNKTFAIKVVAINTTFQEFLNLPNASYISQPSNIRIPLMEWMLLDPNIDIGQASFSIVFSGDTQNENIFKNSRSGRAIMVSLQSKFANAPYVLPAIVSGKAGENFIEFTLGQPSVGQKVAKIILELL